jgi:chromosome segregation ATPase
MLLRATAATIAITYSQLMSVQEQLMRLAAEAAAERHSAEETAADTDARLQQLEHEHSQLTARSEPDAAQIAQLTADAQAAAAALHASTERTQQLEERLSVQEQQLAEARTHVLQLEADVVSRYCLWSLI